MSQQVFCVSKQPCYEKENIFGVVIFSLGRQNATHISWNPNKTPTLIFDYVFFQKLFLPNKEMTTKTRGQLLLEEFDSDSNYIGSDSDTEAHKIKPET